MRVPEADLTPDERRQEVAAILARGVLRMRPGALASADSGLSRPAEKLSESRRNCLEGGATSRPHLPRG